jgi:hypothetical protein
MGRGRDARGRRDTDPFGIAKLARFEVITQVQTKPETADDARIAK